MRVNDTPENKTLSEKAMGAFSRIKDAFGGVGRMFGKKKEVEPIDENKKELFTTLSGEQITPLRKGETVSNVAAKIYNLVKINVADDLKNHKKEKKNLKQFEKLKEKRHKEIVNALLGKGKFKSKIKEAKLDVPKAKKPGVPEIKPEIPRGKPGAPEAPAGKTGAPSGRPREPAMSGGPSGAAPKGGGISPGRGPTTRGPTKLEPAPSPKPSITPAEKIAAPVAGITISSVALASTKGEQNVRFPSDAIGPNNNQKLVKRGDFPDLNTPVVGAATPDVNNSTSYGIFGINNKRKIENGKSIKGSSSIDSFVRMFPKLELPDPGDPSNQSQVKEFNNAWWNLAKTQPENLLKSQLEWHKKTFEDPTRQLVKNTKFANDEGVLLLMTDRKLQGFGSKGALEYAKGASSPEEFINLVTEYDKDHLREYFSKQSDDWWKNNEKGLRSRVELRKNEALSVIKRNKTGSSLNLNTGSSLNDISTENATMKSNLGNSQSPVGVNNTNLIMPVDQTVTTPMPKRDDSSPYVVRNKR